MVRHEPASPVNVIRVLKLHGSDCVDGYSIKEALRLSERPLSVALSGEQSEDNRELRLTRLNLLFLLLSSRYILSNKLLLLDRLKLTR